MEITRIRFSRKYLQLELLAFHRVFDHFKSFNFFRSDPSPTATKIDSPFRLLTIGTSPDSAPQRFGGVLSSWR